ncbi:MAG: signal peptidase I [Chloroflexi bacterium]|nr:signal peptidase I [Chloroflexota bacterium]
MSRSAASAAVIWTALALSLAGCLSPQDNTVVMEDSSMEPTFTARDVLTFQPASRYERGDVVAFDYPFAYPGRPRRTLVARIVGLPGDLVRLGPDELAINGMPVAEPYAKNRDRMDVREIAVLPDRYVVLGDDRANQRDSRWWGQLPAEKVLGRVRVE